MFRNRKYIAAVLCAAMLTSVAVPFAAAAEEIAVVIDVGDLWDDYGDDDPKQEEQKQEEEKQEEEQKQEEEKQEEDEKQEEEKPGDNEPVNPDDSGKKDKDKTVSSHDTRGTGSTGTTTGGNTTGTGSTGTTTGTTTEQPKTQTEEQPKTQTEEQPKDDPKPQVLKTFSDVKPADWFYGDVMGLTKLGVIDGYEDGTFRPQNNVTRAEFLKLLVSLTIDPKAYWEADLFDDVKMTDWYDKYVVTAWYNGYIKAEDYGDKFEPDRPITRREVAKIIVSAFVDGTLSGYQTPYADTADPNAIAMYDLCLMCGSIDPATGERCFYPDTEISRAEVSAVINRINSLITMGQEAYRADFMKKYNVPALQKITK